jgi:chemotaxis regulatin CheY-phosphate phosphatase CheZ
MIKEKLIEFAKFIKKFQQNTSKVIKNFLNIILNIEKNYTCYKDKELITSAFWQC